jgi:hypothetical protein
MTQHPFDDDTIDWSFVPQVAQDALCDGEITLEFLRQRYPITREKEQTPNE